MSYEALLEMDRNTEVAVAKPGKVTFRLDDGEVVLKIDETVVPYEGNEEVINNFYDVPRPFARKLKESPRLVRDIFTHMKHVKQDRQDRDFQFAVVNQDGTRSLSSIGITEKPYIPYGEYGRVLQKLGLEVTDARLMTVHGGAQITSSHKHKAKVEARVGDILESGVMMRVSPTMQFNPQADAFSHRLWCLNGAVENIIEPERIPVIGSTPAEVLAELEKVADRAFKQAEDFNRRFAELTETPPEGGPSEAIHRIARTHRIPQRVENAMLTEAAALPDDEQSMYDVMNIITRYATHEIGDAVKSRDLMQVAGHIADNAACPGCGSTYR